MRDTPPSAHDTVTMDLGEDHADIRASVRAICEGFPASYWRELEDREAYPEAFVKALTDAGYLAALIPEEYGGSGLPLRAAPTALAQYAMAATCGEEPGTASIFAASSHFWRSMA